MIDQMISTQMFKIHRWFLLDRVLYLLQDVVIKVALFTQFTDNEKVVLLFPSLHSRHTVLAVREAQVLGLLLQRAYLEGLGNLLSLQISIPHSLVLLFALFDGSQNSALRMTSDFIGHPEATLANLGLHIELFAEAIFLCDQRDL
jgi:hypothetical protein